MPLPFHGDVLRNEKTAAADRRDAHGGVELPIAGELELFIGPQQHGGLAVAAEPPRAIGLRDSLDAHERVATRDDVATLKFETLVILIGVVFVHTGRQSANEEEFAVVPGHAARTVHQFGHAMLRELGECIAIIDIDPRIGLT